MNSKGRVLTLKMLIKAGACSGQAKRFQDMFGTKVMVTPELAAAVRDSLRVNFLLTFLTQRQRNAAWKKVYKFGNELQQARAASDEKIQASATKIVQEFSGKADELRARLIDNGFTLRGRFMEATDDYNIKVAQYCAERFISAGKKVGSKSRK